jgi:hypothetical protein
MCTCGATGPSPSKAGPSEPSRRGPSPTGPGPSQPGPSGSRSQALLPRYQAGPPVTQCIEFVENKKNIAVGMGVDVLEPQPIQDTTLALTPSQGTDL